MKRLARTAITLLATAALAACGSGGDGGGNRQNEVTAGNGMSAAADTSSNPFAAAEQKMSQAMMSAVGSDVGDNWARKMIAHHQGAIDMSEAVLAQNPTPDVAEMARMDIEKQKKDTGTISKLVKTGAADQKSADLYRPAMMDIQQKMMAAGGKDVSQLYMRKMLEHHKGAVAMSDVALENGVGGALRAQIEKTRAANQQDASMVEAMLSGKPMSEAKASPSSTHAKGPADMSGMNHM